MLLLGIQPSKEMTPNQPQLQNDRQGKRETNNWPNLAPSDSDPGNNKKTLSRLRMPSEEPNKDFEGDTKQLS